MNIYLIRHGETAWNAARIVQMPDTPLNDRGQEQARRVASRMAQVGLEAVVCSDYRRAHATAEAIATSTSAPLEIETLLRERHFGDHRGTPMADIGFDIFAPNHQPPNGESWPQFRERATKAWEAILQKAAGMTGNLAVVTHGLVLRALAERVIERAPHAGDPPSSWPNTCVTVVERHPDWAITLLACAAHLDGDHLPQSAGPVGF